MGIVDDLLENPGVYLGIDTDRAEERHNGGGAARMVVTPLPGRSGVALDYEVLNPAEPDHIRGHVEHTVLARTHDKGVVMVIGHMHAESVRNQWSATRPNWLARPDPDAQRAASTRRRPPLAGGVPSPDEKAGAGGGNNQLGTNVEGDGGRVEDHVIVARFSGVGPVEVPHIPLAVPVGSVQQPGGGLSVSMQVLRGAGNSNGPVAVEAYMKGVSVASEDERRGPSQHHPPACGGQLPQYLLGGCGVVMLGDEGFRRQGHTLGPKGRYSTEQTLEQ
jgi:hypothetical protein